MVEHPVEGQSGASSADQNETEEHRVLGVFPAHSYDAFDHPNMGRRVGVHRSARVTLKPWLAVLAGAVLSVALSVGIIVYFVIGLDNVELPEASDTAPSQSSIAVPGLTDPGTTVTITYSAGDEYAAEELKQFITMNRLGTVEHVGKMQRVAEGTAVLYSDAADEALAIGLAEQLGGVDISLIPESENLYGSALLISLGSGFSL